MPGSRKSSRKAHRGKNSWRLATPGQYNYEGNPERRRFSMLNDLYGGGAIVYFNLLRALAAEDAFKGLRVRIGRGIVCR